MNPGGPEAVGLIRQSLEQGQKMLPAPYSHHGNEAFLGGVFIFPPNNQYFIKETDMLHSRPKREREIRGRVKTRLNKHLTMCERGSCS